MYFVPVGVTAAVVEWITLWSHGLEVASSNPRKIRLVVRCSGADISLYFVSVGVTAAVVEWIALRSYEFKQW